MHRRNIIPEAARHGSEFVFRSGDPQIPDDLRSVAAEDASSIIVIADQASLLGGAG